MFSVHLNMFWNWNVNQCYVCNAGDLVLVNIFTHWTFSKKCRMNYEAQRTRERERVSSKCIDSSPPITNYINAMFQFDNIIIVFHLFYCNWCTQHTHIDKERERESATCTLNIVNLEWLNDVHSVIRFHKYSVHIAFSNRMHSISKCCCGLIRFIW